MVRPKPLRSNHARGTILRSRSLGLGLCLIVGGWSPALAEQGIASVYGNGDGYAWKPVACGGKMDPGAMIAAHKTRPCRSFVRVTHGSRSVTVQIVDRGPFIKGRIIDLSPAAARALACPGLCRVEVR